MVGVRLEDIAARGLRAEELDDEERRDDEQHQQEPPSLPPLGRGSGRIGLDFVTRPGFYRRIRVPVLVLMLVLVLVLVLVLMIVIMPVRLPVLFRRHQMRTKSSPATDVVELPRTLEVSSSRSTAAR